MDVPSKIKKGWFKSKLGCTARPGKTSTRKVHCWTKTHKIYLHLCPLRSTGSWKFKPQILWSLWWLPLILWIFMLPVTHPWSKDSMSSHIGPLRKSITALSRHWSHCSHPQPLFQQGQSNRHLTASKSYYVCACRHHGSSYNHHPTRIQDQPTTRTAAAPAPHHHHHHQQQQQKHLNAGSFHSGVPGRWSIKTRHHAVLLVGGWRCNHATTTATKMAPYPQAQKQHGILDRGASGSIVRIHNLDNDEVIQIYQGSLWSFQTFQLWSAFWCPVFHLAFLSPNIPKKTSQNAQPVLNQVSTRPSLALHWNHRIPTLTQSQRNQEWKT